MRLYGFTVFLGALLLFGAQPLMGKFLLPWFGGGPAVWSACLVFFQVGLLAGYAYAHVLTRWCSLRWQVGLHAGVVITALLALPITPGAGWKPTSPDHPVWRILGLLTGCLGVPCLLVASTSPLLQAWWSRQAPGQSPYRLYALSNLGSLLALVAYPVVVEPWLGRTTQAVAWSWGLGLYGLGVLLCAWKLIRAPASLAPLAEGAQDGSGDKPAGATSERSEDGRQAGRQDRWLWLALPAVGSALLLAVTNKLCRDVAVLPFLWVLPLALYLLTYIAAFDHPRWYRRGVFAGGYAVALVAVCWLLFEGRDVPLPWSIGAHLLALFCACMLCHGELARRRPGPAALTGYYLCIASGGALGGGAVALAAPWLFSGYYEFHWALWLSAWLAVYVAVTDPASPVWFGRQPKRAGYLGFGLAGLGAILAGAAWFERIETIQVVRTFFGVHSVYEYQAGDPEQRFLLLQHDRTTHGLQFMSESRRRLATTYYGPDSGAGLVLRCLRPEGQRRLGCVGLGVGTLAAYGQPGDQFRFYEIDPAVKRLAETRFGYLADCPATVECVLGDARGSLEREPAQRFDALLVDAFSGDTVPAHLLTLEAFGLYFRHLSPEGVLALHISNQHLDLAPVVFTLARRLGRTAVLVDHRADEDQQRLLGVYPSSWVLLTANRALLEDPRVRAVATPYTLPPERELLWTDERHNLLQTLK